MTTAYHRQTNGLVERFNRTFAEKLFMYVDEDHKNWDMVMGFVTFPYNTACHDITGFSPVYPVFRHDAPTVFGSILQVSDMDDCSTTVVRNVYRARQLVRTRPEESNYTNVFATTRLSGPYITNRRTCLYLYSHKAGWTQH